MDIVSRIAELVGFDILFLGGVTIVACCIAAEFWNDPRLVAAVCVSCANRIKKFLGDTEAGTFRYVTLLLGAALLGMIVNLTADRALDEECVVSHLPKLALAAHHIPILRFGRWEAEDELKREAMKTAAPLVTQPKISAILRHHGVQPPRNTTSSKKSVGTATSTLEASPTATPLPTPTPTPTPCGTKNPRTEQAKAFIQHAYPAIEKAESGNIVAGLRYEFLVVKVLRVLLLLVVALYVTLLVSAMRGIFGGTGIQGENKRELWKSRLATICIATVVTFLASQLLLCLWTAQSKRYYRKVIHAYLVVAAVDDRTLLDVAPPPPPTP